MTPKKHAPRTGARVDGLGVIHHDNCREPTWATRSDFREPGKHVQTCTSCGLIWRPGDPAGPATGYTPRATRR